MKHLHPPKCFECFEKAFFFNEKPVIRDGSDYNKMFTVCSLAVSSSLSPDKSVKRERGNKGLKKWASKLLHFHRILLSLPRKIYLKVLHSERYFNNTLLFS